MGLSGKRGGAGWRVIVALVGLVAVLIAYFWVHKPLDPALIFALGGAALDIVASALVVLVAGGLGRRIFGLIIPTASDENSVSLSRAEKVALEGALGLGVLGCIALILGLIGLYQGLVFSLMLIVMVVVCSREMFGWLRDFVALIRRAFVFELGWSRFLAITTLVLLFTALLHTLMPPTAWDALNYHLVGPSRYLDAGRIAAQPDNHFLGFPQGMEILYGVAMGLFGRETAAAPLHWMTGLLGLLAVAGLVRRFSNIATAWLAVTLLVSAFSIWLLFGWPYIDLGVMTYGAAALVAAVAWHPLPPTPSPLHGEGEQNTPVQIENVSIRWLIMIGVFGGLAMGVKYTAAGLLIGLGFFVLVSAPRQFIRNALIIGVSAVVAFLPWAIKGLLLYQNPVYPFIFGGLSWDAMRANTFSTSGSGLLGSANVWQLPILPLAATVFGVEKGDGFSFTSGPWLLTAPFLLLLGWGWLDDRARGLARACVLIGLPMLLFWAGMAAMSAIGIQTRLMMMAMPVAAVLGALGFFSLSRWPHKPLNVYFIAQALVTLTLVFTLIDVVRDTVRMGVLPMLTANLSRDAYLDDNLGVYSNTMRELASLPEGSTVRFMWEPRAYYCPKTITCLPDILFDYWPHAIRMEGKTPDEVFQAWKDAGDDYLLVFDLGYEFNAEDSRFLDENPLFPDALDRWMTPIWDDGVGGYTLYQWK